MLPNTPNIEEAARIREQYREKYDNVVKSAEQINKDAYKQGILLMIADARVELLQRLQRLAELEKLAQSPVPEVILICSKCEKIITSNTTIVFTNCGSIYHLSCGREHKSKKIRLQIKNEDDKFTIAEAIPSVIVPFRRSGENY